MRKFDQYRATGKDKQNEEFHNSFRRDVDSRIHALEELQVSYEAEVERLRGLNLELVQNAIANSLASVEEQTKLIGLMTFFIDGQEKPLQQGAVTFSVPSADLAKITDAGFATLIAASTPSFRMTGPITEIDVDNGEITIVVTAVEGQGTFEEWFMGVGFLAAGQDGVNYRGDYDAEETYFTRDAVYHAASRSTYIATADEPAAAPPSAGWALLAAGGTDGTDGTDGIFAAIASQAEAEAGTDNEKGMTPLRTKEAITALVPKTGFVNLGEVSGAVALDMSAGLVFRFTPTGDVTISVTNVPAGSSRIQVLVDDSGAHAITWPGSFTWDAGSEPTLPASGRTTVDVFTADGGTAWTAFYPVSGLDINGLTDAGTTADEDDEIVFYDVSAGANRKGKFTEALAKAIQSAGNVSYPGNQDYVAMVEGGSPMTMGVLTIGEFFRQTIGGFKNTTDFIYSGSYASVDIDFIQQVTYPRTITLTIHDVTVAANGQLRLAFSDDGGSTFCTPVPVGPTISSAASIPGQYFVIITQNNEASSRGYALVQVWSLLDGMSDLNSYVATHYDHFIVNTDLSGIDEMRLTNSGGNITAVNVRQHMWA